MRSIEYVENNGALKEFIIRGPNADLEQLRDSFNFGYQFKIDGDTAQVTVNKRGLSRLQDWVQEETKVQVDALKTPRKRRIVLAEDALPNCGRPWRLNEDQASMYGVPPEWVGDFVCYQYEN